MNISETPVITKSPGETRALAEKFALSNIQPGTIIALRGELGAGKTCFAQGLAWGLGVDRDTYLSSPTFTIVKEYAGRMAVFHIDLYRLESPEEALDAGIGEYLLEKGAVIIEWPEKIAELLNSGNIITVDIEAVSPDERRIRIHTGN